MIKMTTMYSIRTTSLLLIKMKGERTLTAYRLGNAIGGFHHMSIIY